MKGKLGDLHLGMPPPRVIWQLKKQVNVSLKLLVPSLYSLLCFHLNFYTLILYKEAHYFQQSVITLVLASLILVKTPLLILSDLNRVYTLFNLEEDTIIARPITTLAKLQRILKAAMEDDQFSFEGPEDDGRGDGKTLDAIKTSNSSQGM